MGGEGHMADMNQRIKQNQTLLRRRRERSRNLLETIRENTHSPRSKDFSIEKLEQAEKELAIKEQADKLYYFRFTFIFFTFILLLVLLAFWIFK